MQNFMFIAGWYEMKKNTRNMMSLLEICMHWGVQPGLAPSRWQREKAGGAPKRGSSPEWGLVTLLTTPPPLVGNLGTEVPDLTVS